jgi:hypothetical protein
VIGQDDAWTDHARQWLDTPEKEQAARLLITKLWDEKTEPYWGDLVGVAFLYVCETSPIDPSHAPHSNDTGHSEAT